MLCFSALIKKMSAVSLACAMSAPIVSASTVPTTYDSYAQEFAYRYSNDRVEYRDDKLILYADPSMVLATLKAVASVIALTCTAGTAVYVVNAGNQPGQSVFGAVICGIVFGAVGCWAGLSACRDFSLKINKTPYITLDASGLTFIDGGYIAWGDVDHIAIATEQHTTGNTYHINQHVSTTSNQTITVMALLLRDKYNSILFSLDERDSYLPISFDQFRALVEHYSAMYGKRG
jgi:hypothetical protein